VPTRWPGRPPSAMRMPISRVYGVMAYSVTERGSDAGQSSSASVRLTTATRGEDAPSSADKPRPTITSAPHRALLAAGTSTRNTDSADLMA
jgi:hypothetical protein